jgi:4-hydroxy-tetrahydrodipicolinate reductase
MSERSRVVVNGAAGRMGRLVLGELLRAPDLQLAGAVVRPGSPMLGRDVTELAGGGAPLEVKVGGDLRATLIGGRAVVIDFSLPAATAEVASACAEAGAALVTGTTGVDATGRAALEQAARRVAVVAAPNMSTGVTVLLRLVEEAARLLGSGYDPEVIESHHNKKADAPSGTALALVAALHRGLGASIPGADGWPLRHGREGQVGARPPAEIGVHAVRAGDIVGEHTVLLAAEGERLELSHRASSRLAFARGAVRAARWLCQDGGRRPGLYSMRDVLGL